MEERRKAFTIFIDAQDEGTRVRGRDKPTVVFPAMAGQLAGTDVLALHLCITCPSGKRPVPQRDFLCWVMADISQELVKDGNTICLGLGLRV